MWAEEKKKGFGVPKVALLDWMVIRFAMSTQWSWRKPALEEFRRIKKTQCTAGFKLHFYVVSGSEMLLMQAYGESSCFRIFLLEQGYGAGL